jgi:hypothetical protein
MFMMMMMMIRQECNGVLQWSMHCLQFSLPLYLNRGACGSVVVKALSYKTEGRGFDTR